LRRRLVSGREDVLAADLAIAVDTLIGYGIERSGEEKES
jgi:hypothetical protein